MKYIALLRGINISGKNKISMNELKIGFEEIGYKEVKTHLNSGNVIFESNINDKKQITENIQMMIKNKFNYSIPVFITTKEELKCILDNSPKWWGTDNKEIYDNIIFIIPPATYEEIYNTIGAPKEDLEKISEYKNIIFWSYILKYYQKTNWWPKTANTTINDKITIRTANTVKKLLELSSK